MAATIALLLFSTGWLVPFTFSVAAAYDFMWRVLWPMAASHDSSHLSTFHVFQWSAPLLYITVVWLAAVIGYWVLRATKSRS